MDIETRYIDPETGKLLSARDFLMKLVGTLPALYRDEAQLRQAWANPERREELLSRLAERGIGPDQLEDLRSMFGAQDSDIFDVLAHISYGTDMLSRSDRRHIAEPILAEYGTDMARDFVDFLLSLYVREGILGFRRGGLSDKIRLFGRGTTSEIAAAFGGNKDAVRAAYYRVQESLYVK